MEEQTARHEQAALTEQPQPQSQPPAVPLVRRRVWDGETFAVLLLVFVLLLGAYFRFVGLNWDDGTHLHPDERFLTDVANRMQPVGDPLAYLRTSESTLNPHNLGFDFFVYGHFPMIATRYVAEWVSNLCEAFPGRCDYNYNHYDGIHLVGRALSGLVDLVAVAVTFFIGRRLYDWQVGLLGALLLALAVMPIQQSHFFTTDNWATVFSVLTMYAAGSGNGRAKALVGAFRPVHGAGAGFAY